MPLRRLEAKSETSTFKWAINILLQCYQYQRPRTCVYVELQERSISRLAMDLWCFL